MVQVKFTKFGANSALGGFAPGDRARLSDALARHLVDEAQVAVYAEPAHVGATVQTAAPVPAATPAASAKAGKRSK
jgi:hypothetical protein